MKTIMLYFAVLFYAIGVVVIIDWFIFLEKHNDLYDDFPELKTKYISRFPAYLKSLFELNPQPAAIIFFFTFTVSGIIFLQQKHKGYTILAVTSFIFGMWNLFSIM